MLAPACRGGARVRTGQAHWLAEPAAAHQRLQLCPAQPQRPGSPRLLPRAALPPPPTHTHPPPPPPPPTTHPPPSTFQLQVPLLAAHLANDGPSRGVGDEQLCVDFGVCRGAVCHQRVRQPLAQAGIQAQRRLGAGGGGLAVCCGDAPHLVSVERAGRGTACINLLDAAPSLGVGALWRKHGGRAGGRRCRPPPVVCARLAAALHARAAPRREPGGEQSALPTSWMAAILLGLCGRTTRSPLTCRLCSPALSTVMGSMARARRP